MSQALNYSEYFLVFDFAVSGCISISTFASLVDAPVGNERYAVWWKICVITAGIKKVFVIPLEKEW